MELKNNCKVGPHIEGICGAAFFTWRVAIKHIRGQINIVRG